MPTGMPPSVAALTAIIHEHFVSTVAYLQIPSYNDTSLHFQVAFRDSVKASQSTIQLLKLTCRPFVILLGLISRYMLVVLKILCEHTIYHAILAAKESWRQLKIAASWFIAFQRGLSRAAVGMEIGFVFLCIGLYMIRRYLQKKKYFQRLWRWYRSKKRNVQLKYNNFVDTVAQTSLVLALLLPHILYVTITLVLKYCTPTIVRYLAVNTISADLISFYIPFVRTIMVVYKYKNLCTIAEKERAESDVAAAASSGAVGEKDRPKVENNKTQQSSGLLSFFRSVSKDSKTSSVADEYKKAATRGSSKTRSASSKTQKSMSKTTALNTAKVPTTLDAREMNEISQEAIKLLKYWTVYAILTALIQTATLLPIVGRILYNANPTNAKKAAASISRWSRGHNRVSWLEKIKLSTQFLEECKLFFFAWLRLLPTSFTSLNHQGADGKGNNFTQAKSSNDQKSTVTGSVKSHIKSLEKQSKLSASTRKSTSIRRKQPESKEVPFSNQPLDIMYERLAPIAVSLVSTSTNIVKDTSSNAVGKGSSGSSFESSSAFQSFKTKCIVFSRTVLEAMVWTKIISESTKNLILNTFNQCTSLLPAAITMMMPSYFTNYGVIYVRLLVPCANSSTTCDAFEEMKKEVEDENMIISDDGIADERWITISFAMIRHLQYWTIQAISSSILLSFAPVLAWVPLSTHMVWLVWAYAQLETSTKKLYALLEWELVAFGILKKNTSISQGDMSGNADGKEMDVNETMTMQLVNKIMKKVPLSLTAGNQTEATETETEETHENNGVVSEKTGINEQMSKLGASDLSINPAKGKVVEQSNDEVKSSTQITSKVGDSRDSDVSNEIKVSKKEPSEEAIAVIEVKKQSSNISEDVIRPHGSLDENEYVCISSEADKKAEDKKS